ncbi:MAG TPA: MarR family transcriptional regulator [Gemmatimonadaceae bacterium]
MAATPRTKAALSKRIWRSMFRFLMRTGPQRARALARRGLTPNDSRALGTLDAKQGRTMRSLAAEWECDASNATWIVDRLERLGLARRQAVQRDRRVKLVVLTAKGVRTRAEILDKFHAPPADLRALGRGELERLDRALRALDRP